MGKKLDYVQLIKDVIMGHQYGLEQISIEDHGKTIRSWDVGLPVTHIPDHHLKISMRGYLGGECAATFRGPNMWRNCYRFIKSAHKHL